MLKRSTVFPFLTISNDVEEFLSDNNDRGVLVTNYNCVRATEFSNVILLLDANEYHVKQFIPETIARCQSNFSIAVKPAEKRIIRGDDVMELMKYWENVNSEQEQGKFIIEIMKLEFCNCTSVVMCAKKKVVESRIVDASNFCKIHKNTKIYKEISSQIKHKRVSDTPSNQSRKKEALKL